VTENEEGHASAVCGVALTAYLSKHLQTICSCLAIRGVKNAKKIDVIDRITNIYTTQKAYSHARQQKQGTTPQAQYQPGALRPQAEQPCHHGRRYSAHFG
jgi:hypothetical protein